MVGAARLKTIGARLAALLVVVLLLHMAALRWLAREMEASPLLHAMPRPMFTRLLQQSAAPAPPPPREHAPARPKARHVAARAVALAAKPPEPPASSPPAASLAEPPAEKPPFTEPPAPAPVVAPVVAQAASAPQPPASAASASVAANLDSWPVDTRLSYRLGGQYRSGELHGRAHVQWLRKDDKYETRIDISVTLLAHLVLTSQGEVTAQGLYPRIYEEVRGSSPRSARLGEDTIVLNDGRTMPRPPGAQDTASQFVELSHRFASGAEPLQVGRSVGVWLARPGGVDLWTYDVVERETLRTPGLGNIEAFHLKPRPLANPRGNITAEMWFAPSLQYLPVRIKVTMGEETFVDLLVDKIEQR
ncbi:DUF3108 domain-containing protein [Caenimonas aquaedulcis]|uniref:DUF3108 domain-containing protein n=1 Tax=Caenimonas aquaedulcis TaxID=2793270 RepID=A0A931H6C2_9BURK|nr:DUF3108 domain-containing protein [Caenimonas aquaedulcis]MBG9389470.1 DUF3108 domain-containing protein [Caenimonas aquaedulcis]